MFNLEPGAHTPVATGGIRVQCLPNFFVFHQTLLYPKWFCDFYLQTVTDLRIGQIGHGLGSRAFGVPRNSFPWRLIIKLKFGKLRRGITSQYTLKRAKMQMSRPYVSNWWPAGQMWPATPSYEAREASILSLSLLIFLELYWFINVFIKANGILCHVVTLLF